MNHFTHDHSARFGGDKGRIELLPSGITYIRLDHDGEISSSLTHDVLVCITVLNTEQRPLLLIDRVRPYWLSFEAQRTLMEHTFLDAVAYWVRRPMAYEMADYAASTYFEHVPVRAFRRHEGATEWLTTFLPTPVKAT